MQKIVESFLENLTTRNWDKLGELFDENIDWLISGNEHKVS